MTNNAMNDTLSQCKSNAGYSIIPQDGIGNNLAEGHNIVREKLCSDIGKVNFESDAASKFRTYMASTILSTTLKKNDIDNTSSEYSDVKGSIQFYANGTFFEVLSGHISLTEEGMRFSSSITDFMPGYWDVATLPNGILVILMYSTHPKMLANSPNGFLPFVVAEHTTNFVALPGGAGYYRTERQNCN